MSLIKAVAYLRTSSATNLGSDKDSEPRQRTAIGRFARSEGFDLVAEFCDQAVSGSDPIETRPGFSALLDRIEQNGVRTVILEDASRLARDLIVQELGLVALIRRGVRVLTSSGIDLTATDDPLKKALRQITGAFEELERARLISKLKVARERRKAQVGKCEGRKSYAEMRPDLVAEAKRLRRRSKKGDRRSLREVSALLAEKGYFNLNGKPLSAERVRSMTDGGARRIGRPVGRSFSD